jgi:hypothetical protein
MKIVRFIRFPDLKQLYLARIPSILALVQSDLIFNYDVIFNEMPFLTVYKFKTDYARGLKALDIAIQMTRIDISPRIWAGRNELCAWCQNDLFEPICDRCMFNLNHHDEIAEIIERNRTSDYRHFVHDMQNYSDRYTKLKSILSEDNIQKQSKQYKTKPVSLLSPFITHSIGYRRTFCGSRNTLKLLREWVHDDFYSNNPSETKKIVEQCKRDGFDDIYLKGPII